MEKYSPKDVTVEARSVVEQYPNPTRIAFKDSMFGEISERKLQFGAGLAADGKVSARNLRCITYGSTEVELSNCEQLVEISQAKAIMDILQLLGDGKPGFTQSKTFTELLDTIQEMLLKQG